MSTLLVFSSLGSMSSFLLFTPSPCAVIRELGARSVGEPTACRGSEGGVSLSSYKHPTGCRINPAINPAKTTTPQWDTRRRQNCYYTALYFSFTFSNIAHNHSSQGFVEKCPQVRSIFTYCTFYLLYFFIFCIVHIHILFYCYYCCFFNIIWFLTFYLQYDGKEK